MPNVTTAAARTSSVRVPESIRRLLADPFRMEGEPMLSWTAPTKLPADCTVQMLRDFVDRIGASLKPAPADTIQACIKALAHGTAHKAATTKDWQYQTKLYARTLDDIPSDVWFEVTKELLKTYEWFPGTAAIAKRAEPILVERRKQLDRARATLAAFTDPQRQIAAPVKPKADPDAERDRLRELLAEQQAADVTDDVRLFNTAQTERALALIERRPIAEWAARFFEERGAARGSAGLISVGRAASAVVPTRQISPTPKSAAALKRSNARWARSQGRGADAARLEAEADALDPQHVEEPVGDEHGEAA